MTQTIESDREFHYAEAQRRSGTSISRMIGRCPVKGCGYIVTTDIVVTRSVSPITTVFGTWGFETKRSFAYPESVCGHTLRWSAINATHSDTKCGPRCWNAKHADCECECDGANHGSSHAA